MTSEPHAVAVVSLEQPYGYQPEHYVGVVIASGDTVAEAVRNLEERAVHLARESQPAIDEEGSPPSYAVLGLRMAAGITASGQPEWVAYGTLARGRGHVRHPRTA
jgi:hypothetical protein